MSQIFDNASDFDATGIYSCANGVIRIPVLTALPTITVSDGQMFYHSTERRLYWTQNSRWYYAEAN